MSGSPRRRILVHDFAGHPFQAQLSRYLAGRGNTVSHAFCGSVSTGRGDLARRPGDAATLSFTSLGHGEFERYRPLGRLRCELQYGIEVSLHLWRFRPDVVVSANTPLLAQLLLWMTAAVLGVVRVYWIQDFLGRGTRAVLAERSALLGRTAGRGLERLEGLLIGWSHGVVPISEDFVAEIAPSIRRGQPVRVIENWAPLDEVTPVPKANDWSRAAQLDRRPLALYSGTLGLKHDPGHLVATAQLLAESDGVVVVVTEGRGRQWLEAERTRLGLENLILVDYVDYAVLPQLLGSADVGLVLLERSAGTFSVPSKVLTYLAAGTPIVAAMPPENLGARTIERADAGVVVECGDHDGFAKSVAALLADAPRRTELAGNARSYAERTFDIDHVGAAMTALIDAATATAHARRRRRSIRRPRS